MEDSGGTRRLDKLGNSPKLLQLGTPNAAIWSSG
jgi:hypothetical protein